MSAQFDYIIVGAGPAGCVLASRLSENPDVKVLLLEAGGRDSNFLFHWPAGFARMTKGIASWGWSTVPQRHMQGRVLWYTQAKVLGGGSTINAQIYTRGNALDYDAWRDEAGCEDWGYRDLLPYFKRAEGNQRFDDEFHGVDGPLGVAMPRGALPICDAFIRAGQQAGLPYNPDFNGRYQRGIGYYQLTQRDARRSSAAVAFLRPAMPRPNLTVMSNAEVRRILVERGRATGVEVKEGTALRRIACDREVLVSSGAIGSPRLLLLSGIGPARHLGSVGVKVVHDLPGVGENLQDHVDLCVLCECSGDHSYDRVQRPHRMVAAGLQYMLFKTGPVVSSLFETGGFWYADPAARSPDIQFHFGQGSGIETGIAKLQNPGVTLNTAFMRPRSRGSVRLKSADPADAPLIDPNYWADPYDLEMSLRGLELGRQIMAQPALAPFLKREVLPGADIGNDPSKAFDYACRMAKTDHHPVGTCKMGHDAMSVVGVDLKVHGIDGLRVCDSSIMPLINSSNTNAPTIMIGEKGADLVRGRPALPSAVFSWERNEPRPFAEA
ncbi:GMC family oxidoreductase [Labrys neptuniae]